LDVEISNWPCGRKSRSLAFGTAGKGEARTALLEGPKPARGNPPVSLWHGRKTKPSVLNPANRRIRTRMYGGVGGEESRDSPYPDCAKASETRPMEGTLPLLSIDFGQVMQHGTPAIPKRPCPKSNRPEDLYPSMQQGFCNSICHERTPSVLLEAHRARARNCMGRCANRPLSIDDG
jgi:hypothetical protein